MPQLPADEHELQLNLYENAIDSIRHAIEHYSFDRIETRRYKYAILHLAQGVALLLKERLSREHPNFIFTNVADSTSEKTVDIDLSIVRLEKIAKITFGSAKELIQELAKLRNRIEHYAATINKRQAASIIARTVVFLEFFIRVELGKDFRQEIGNENWVALLSIDEYLGHAKREVEIKLRADNAPIFLCDSCNSHTATITERRSRVTNRWTLNYEEITCLVCQRKVAYREECRRCGKTMLFIDPTSLVWHSYCENCKDILKDEYPGLRLPEYAGEVRRWFQEHEVITTAQLIDLLFNIAMFGSSRYIYVDQLIEQKLIGFVSEKDRELYYSSFAGGYRPEVTFRWIYTPNKASDQN